MDQRVAADRDGLTRRIIGLGIRVHRTVGPGCLEAIYEDCLAFEFEREGVRFERQVTLSLDYEGHRFSRAYKADFVVEEAVVVEIKSVDLVSSVHRSQLLTYLRLSGCRVGLLMNFNVVMLKHGLVRVVL